MAEISEGDSNFDALFKAFVMIVVSEIGDKTFLIAAIMATRHPRVTVFGGAFASLVVMSILSAALGRVILGLIPKVWTLWAASILFLVFGIKMLQESFSMAAGNFHIQEEMREVEEELEEDSAVHDSHNARGTSSNIPLESLEEGKVLIGPLEQRHWTITVKEKLRNIIQLLTNPVFAQAFVLTFLGEWGDRSQITTIAMGGAHSVPVIAFGTILGHGVCTAGAVVGGRYLSTKISVKHISLLGSAAFIIFAFLYALEAYYYRPELDDGAF
ncbi:vacuolar protein [Kwoniella mangroviensis CBS 10435]|uniref:GDT1 family protein n=1 Tax=Kwoniella mangroviensis CBS 10435 TaxID=1331196 RepID=A0A1B9IP89_9TREE|nr:vacuolar protein [Kwoniella mangroviensis CBS 10435]